MGPFLKFASTALIGPRLHNTSARHCVGRQAVERSAFDQTDKRFFPTHVQHSAQGHAVGIEQVCVRGKGHLVDEHTHIALLRVLIDFEDLNVC